MFRMCFPGQIHAIEPEDQLLVATARILLRIKYSRLEAIDLLFGQSTVVVAVSVGIHMEPDLVQHIRAVVHILHLLRSIEHVSGIV